MFLKNYTVVNEMDSTHIIGQLCLLVVIKI